MDSKHYIADQMSIQMPSVVDPSPAEPTELTPEPSGASPMYELIELFFFAYRDFVGDADRLLADYGFGRAHHRVLHFVNRRPGLTIAELLDILRITKQSLNRVLRELVEKDFIDARAGTLDRRRRQLYVTPTGEHLALQLAKIQTLRFASALAQTGDVSTVAKSFLSAMIDPQEERRTSLEGAFRNAHIKDDN